MQTLTPKCARGLGSTRVQTLAAAALFEILSPIKFAMHCVSEGLHALIMSDARLFHEFFAEPTGKAMQPVMLCILVMSQDHLDKTVTSPGVGAYVKGDNSFL